MDGDSEVWRQIEQLRKESSELNNRNGQLEVRIENLNAMLLAYREEGKDGRLELRTAIDKNEARIALADEASARRYHDITKPVDLLTIWKANIDIKMAQADQTAKAREQADGALLLSLNTLTGRVGTLETVKTQREGASKLLKSLGAVWSILVSLILLITQVIPWLRGIGKATGVSP